MAISYRRIEVITGQRQRRRWTAQEKARIVAESFEEGAKHFPRVAPPQWRWPVGCSRWWANRSWRAAAGANARGFVPVRIISEGRCRDGRRAGPRCAFAHDAAGDGLATGPDPRGDRDRGERGAHPGRAGGRSDDAFDGAIGAARRGVIALRAGPQGRGGGTSGRFSQVGAHAVSALVSEALRAKPLFAGDVFVFRSKSAWIE